MPFSYDVDPTQSNRANRRRLTQESKSLDNEVINTKALGARISDIRYDPNAIDGDGDGLVQEGSPYERPATLSNVAGLVRGLSSRMSTGDYGYNSEGSWTKGLTNEEIAERVVPDSPAKAVEAISASIGSTNAIWTLDGAMNSVTEVMEGGVDGLIFDEKKIAELRKMVVQSLDESPLFRDAVDKFGIPPILIGKFNKDHSGATAMMHDSVVMTIADSNLDSIFKRGVFETMGQRVGKIFSPSVNFKGTKRHTVGSTTEDTIRHEWGHYLNALVSNLHPDQSQRDFSDSLRADSWYDIWQSKGNVPMLGELFTFMDGISREGTFDFDPPPSNVPWINTSYGQTSPVEFFAESISAYFSPDKKKRALLNEAGARVVERMLGTQDTPVGGLSSRNVHNQDLNKLSNTEIANLVVPDSPEALEALMNELNDLRGGSDVSIEDSLKETFGATDVVDFHPVRVAQMREHVANMLEANPQFKKAVQAYGMPPVAFASPDYNWDVFDTPPQACYSTNGAPVILFNPNAFDKAEEYDNWMEAPSRNFFEKIKKRLSVADANTTGNQGLPDTTRMAVGTDHDATLIHEWSHYVHDLAMFTHPDEQTRNDLSFFWNRDWDSAQELGEALDLMPDGKSQLFDLTGDIKDAIDNGDPLPETTPFVRTWYGQSSPVEMFAEGMTAYLHGDGSYRDLNSARMNKVIERMFNPPSSDETIDVVSVDTSRSVSGLSSKTVKRDANGVRDISDNFNALSGANWLQDATDEEIADAVVPMNVDDMIEMALHTSMFGRPDTTDPQVIQAYRDLLRRKLVTEEDGKHFLDFSPEGREKAKQIIKDALAESPEFAWAVRQFGLPPVVCTDGKAIHDFIKNGGQISDMLDAVQPDEKGLHGVAGWSTGSFYIGLNMASQAMELNLPSGFHPRIMRKVGPDGKPYITNFGYSRADTLRHEFGHYLWSSMCENFYKKDKLTNREERAKYFFPHLSEQEGKDRITELLKTFDASSLILSSDEGQRQKFINSVVKGNMPPQAKDAIVHMINKLTVDPDAWTPTYANQVQDIMEAFDPMYKRFPLLYGEYALFNRQELWAEAISLFFSPDKGMRNRYMTDELRGYVAKALGLDVDSNGKHTRPWIRSGGLSSRAEPIAKRTITVADNFSQKPSGTSRRDFNPLPEASIAEKSPSLITMSLGDDKWILDTGGDNTQLWNRASQAWTTEEGHESMRFISASLMGLGTMGDNGNNSGIVGSIVSGTAGSGNTDLRDEVREMAQHTFAGLTTIREGNTITDKPHSRVLENVGPDSPLMTTEINSDITMPMTSFGDEARTREVLTTPSSTPRTLVTLRSEAQVAPLKDGEVVTAGVFKVVRRDITDDGVARIELEHTRTFDPSQGRTVPLRSKDRSGLASSNRPLRREETDIAERAKESLQKDLDAKRAEIDGLQDENRRLRLAMEELQATGSWQGEKYDIRINDQGILPPVTATREEIEAQALKNGLTLEEEIAEYVKDIEAAGYARKYKIDQLQKKLDRDQENFDTITKDRADNTFHIEELLAVPEIAEEIRRRRDEVMALSYGERDKRWSDPSDPEAYYVIHWGASQFVGGELDPARSRGTDGPIRAGDTRSINLHTARPYVDETKRIREEQEATKKLLEELRAGKEINVGPDGRIRSQERRILDSFNLSQAVREDGTFDWADIKENLGDRYQEWIESQFARIQEHIDKNEPRISRRERISEQLVADGYQYSSAYNARALTQGFAGYGGRYADEGAEIGAGASSGDGVQRSSITGIHIFRVTPETATSLGGGEDHLIGKHRPIATLVAKNDGMSDTNVAVNTWEGWVDMAIQQDIASRQPTTVGMSSRSMSKEQVKATEVNTSIQERVTSLTSNQQNISGLSSRGIPTNPSGKSVEEVAKEIELTPDEEDTLVQILPDVSKLEDMEVNPSLEGMKEELIDSVRVTVGEDGVPFIYAMPHPLLTEEIPDKRDWSAVVRPKKETAEKVRALIDEILKQAMGDDTLEDFYTRATDGGDKYEEITRREDASKLLRYAFSEWSIELLKKIADKNPFDSENNEYIGGLVGGEMGGIPTFLQMWAQGIQDLNAPELRTFVGIDEFLNSHDVWGHVGTGRGFDRHGEWTNMLAMFSLMDRWAEEKGISKQDLTLAKASWFQSLEYNRVNGEFHPPKEELQSRDKWWIHSYSYSIAPTFATDEQMEELISLIDDGNTHDTGKSSGLSSANRATKAEIAKTDIVRQTMAYGALPKPKSDESRESTSGLSSRYSRSARKITKNFRVGAEPRPKPATRRELVNRGVPTNPAQLADILEKSPFSKGKDKKHILDMIDTMEVDWEAQEKLAQKLEKVLADSPGFEELLGEYDIPMMLVTKWGAKRDEIWGGDRKRLDINRWFNIEGEYHPEFGIVTFPERIANRDYVTNAVSDGPVSTEDVIRHELSHTIHAMAMGRSKKARKAYEKDTAEMLDKLNRAIKDAKDSGASEIQLSSIRVLPDEDHTAAGAISRYAQTKRSEYIAELLTHMLPGKNTKPVILLESHYEMLSEFLDIPVSRLKELAAKSGKRPAFI